MIESWTFFFLSINISAVIDYLNRSRLTQLRAPVKLQMIESYRFKNVHKMETESFN